MTFLPHHPSSYGAFLDEEKLALEDQRYGDAGDNPQVVWALSHLASSAVGVFVDLVTDWTGLLHERLHLVYRGNEGTINPCRRLPSVPRECSHYKFDYENVAFPLALCDGDQRLTSAPERWRER